MNGIDEYVNKWTPPKPVVFWFRNFEHGVFPHPEITSIRGPVGGPIIWTGGFVWISLESCVFTLEFSPVFTLPSGT